MVDRSTTAIGKVDAIDLTLNGTQVSANNAVKGGSLGGFVGIDFNTKNGSSRLELSVSNSGSTSLSPG